MRVTTAFNMLLALPGVNVTAVEFTDDWVRRTRSDPITTYNDCNGPCFSIQCVALKSDLARNLRSRDRRWRALVSQFAYLEDR